MPVSDGLLIQFWYGRKAGGPHRRCASSPFRAPFARPGAGLICSKTCIHVSDASPSAPVR